MKQRLAALADRFAVPPDGQLALARFLDLLAGDEHAPTAVRAPELAVETHIADALSGLLVPELDRARAVADIGAGAGLPGLVLAAARPDLRAVEVESAARKCAFIERAIASMGLTNAQVVCARVEEWRLGRETCDAVTARAVAPLSVLVEYAAPLLTEGGVFVAWKGIAEPAEVADGTAAAARLGLQDARVVDVPPFPGGDLRRLYVYLKVRSLPDGFPRRAGIARKRPLRA